MNRLNLTEYVVFKLCGFTLFPEIAPDDVVSGEVGKTSPSSARLDIVVILFSHSVSLGISGRLKLLLILSTLLVHYQISACLLVICS